MRFENDGFLALHEATRIKATGDIHVRPLETVINVDPEWEQDVFTALAVLRWLDDYYNHLSPELRMFAEQSKG